MLSGVSKTAILTLRARADEHRRTDRLFADPLAVEMLERIAWPPELDFWYRRPKVASFLAARADEIDGVVVALAKELDSPTVVELGAGLSSRRERLGDRFRGRWIDLDLPEVIALRSAVGAGTRSDKAVACSVLDRRWLDEFGPAGDAHAVILVAEGLFYYLPRAEVGALLVDLKRRLAGAAVVFDVVGALDFDATLAQSESAGTPIQWMAPAPFERTLADLGLRIVPGFEPDALMRRAIDRYGPRYGMIAHRTIDALSRIKAIRDRRSGTLVGRL